MRLASAGVRRSVGPAFLSLSCQMAVVARLLAHRTPQGRVEGRKSYPDRRVAGAWRASPALRRVTNREAAPCSRPHPHAFPGDVSRGQRLVGRPTSVTSVTDVLSRPRLPVDVGLVTRRHVQPGLGDALREGVSRRRRGDEKVRERGSRETPPPRRRCHPVQPCPLCVCSSLTLGVSTRPSRPASSPTPPIRVRTQAQSGARAGSTGGQGGAASSAAMFSRVPRARAWVLCASGSITKR